MEEKNPSKDRKGASAFVILLRVLAIASLISSMVIGDKLSVSHYGFNGMMTHYDHTMLFAYVLCGVLAASLWWALSIIVDACQKYTRGE